MKHIEVVAAIIEHEGKYLARQRGYGDWHGNSYAFGFALLGEDKPSFVATDAIIPRRSLAENRASRG